MKKAKQEILRLACLSYSIVMLSISNKYADEAQKAIDLLRAKKIITEKEIKQLGFDKIDGEERFFSANGGAMLKWWRPLNWAMWKIQQETETPTKKGKSNTKQVEMPAMLQRRPNRMELRWMDGFLYPNFMYISKM